MRPSRRLAAVLTASAVLATVGSPARAPEDARLEASSRGARNGWIMLRLQGTPSGIGYQHGTLLAPEIGDVVAVARLSLTHDGKRDWAFYRNAAETVFWPLVDAEYARRCGGSPTAPPRRG